MTERRGVIKGRHFTDVRGALLLSLIGYSFSKLWTISPAADAWNSS